MSRFPVSICRCVIKWIFTCYREIKVDNYQGCCIFVRFCYHITHWRRQCPHLGICPCSPTTYRRFLATKTTMQPSQWLKSVFHITFRSPCGRSRTSFVCTTACSLPLINYYSFFSPSSTDVMPKHLHEFLTRNKHWSVNIVSNDMDLKTQIFC